MLSWLFSWLRGSTDNAQHLADQVTSLKDLRDLERLLKKEWEAGNTTTSQIIEQAIEIAEQVHGTWYFIPELTLHTPISILSKAYTMFSGKERARSLPELGYDHWQLITPYDEYRQSSRRRPYFISHPSDKEKPEVQIAIMIEFRRIVESPLAHDERVDQINRFVSKHRRKSSMRSMFTDYYFDFESDLSPGDQWCIVELQDDGVPAAEMLYRLGYTTLPMIINSIDELRSQKGIGPKRLEQLEQIKKRHDIS